MKSKSTAIALVIFIFRGEAYSAPFSNFFAPQKKEGGKSVKKVATTVALLLILFFMLVSLPQIGSVKAEGIIYIRADGAVEEIRLLKSRVSNMGCSALIFCCYTDCRRHQKDSKH